jgi:signal transduction histidine kinase
MVATIHILITGILLVAVIWLIAERRSLKRALVLRDAERDQALETKNKIVAALSHDVLAPLRLIGSVARREAAASGASEGVRIALEKIGRTAEALYYTSLNVVSWMKYQENGYVLKEERVSPAETAWEAIDLLSYMAEGKNNRILNRIPGDMVLYTDKTIFRIVLVNLVSNAIKFTSEGEIVLGGGYEEEKITILVQDSGVGFSQEVLEQLRRSSEAITSTPGTDAEPGHGVGYSIIIHFLKLLGGTFEIQSRSGEGASVFIILPKKRYR